MGAIFLTTTDGEKIQDTRDTASELRRIQDSTPGRRQGDIAAKLTAFDSGTGYYSWTEQAFDTTGVRYNKPGGLSGTATYMPAIPLGSANGFQAATFPVQVWLRPAIVAGNLGMVWEILGSTIEVDLVEKICVTTYGGYVTEVNIQKGTYQLFGQRVTVTGEETCVTSDADCCEFVRLSALSAGGCEFPAITVARTLHAVFTLSGGCTGTYEADLVYDSGTGRWNGTMTIPEVCDQTFDFFIERNTAVCCWSINFPDNLPLCSTTASCGGHFSQAGVSISGPCCPDTTDISDEYFEWIAELGLANSSFGGCAGSPACPSATTVDVVITNS